MIIMIFMRIFRVWTLPCYLSYRANVIVWKRREYYAIIIRHVYMKNYRTQKRRFIHLYFVLSFESVWPMEHTITRVSYKEYMNLCIASNLPWSYGYCFRHLESPALIFTFPVGTTNTVKIIKILCASFLISLFYFFSNLCLFVLFSFSSIIIIHAPPDKDKKSSKVCYIFIYMACVVIRYGITWSDEHESKKWKHLWLALLASSSFQQ